MGIYLLYEFIALFNSFIIFYVFIMNGIFLVQVIVSLLAVAAYTKKTHYQEYRLMSGSMNMIPFSLLVPAFNEEVTIVESIKSMLSINYSNFEIVVINDGSKDNTLKAVVDAFGLRQVDFPVRKMIETKEVRGIYYNPEIPRIKLIDKANGGKSDALNAGINLSQYPYFITVDADSLLTPDALLHIAMSFIKDKHTVAVGGVIRLSNGCDIEDGKIKKVNLPENIWARFQLVEYFRSFMVGRVGWDAFNSLLIISGAFGAFQKEHALAVGGYTTKTVGEDMDLVVKLHKYMLDKKYKYKVAFLPDPICWTQAPEDLNMLYRQRRRWHIGLIDVLYRNKDMFLNPKYKAVGMFSMPFQFLFEMIAPIIEILGYIFIPISWFLGALSTESFIMFLIVSIFLGIIISIGSLLAEEFTNNNDISIKDFLHLALFCVAENLFYRQMTVFFRLMGIILVRKNKHIWGVMTRKEFTVDRRSNNERRKNERRDNERRKNERRNHER